MNPKYEIILYWSEDDQAFVAEVPELPGCMAHGDSQASAFASVNEAIALWIATVEELGRAVPTPKEPLIYSSSRGATRRGDPEIPA